MFTGVFRGGSNGVKGYPLFLNLEGKHCLVFGGGEVAARKIHSLLKRGARVTCVSKEFSRAVRNLGQKNRGCLTLKRISNGKIHFNEAQLVIAATSDRPFNERIARECRRKKIWVNVVDDPKLCDFTVPAVLERGPLQVAVSTGGTSPLFAKRLRQELQKVIPPSTGKLLEKLGKIRRGARGLS